MSSIRKRNNLRLAFVFMVMTALFPITSPAEAVWSIETVDDPKTFYDSDIVLDSSNHPHIAYGGDQLYYAYFDGAQWQYEVVDSATLAGYYISVAIDSNNKVHISYVNSVSHDLKYATNASGSWVIKTIDNVGKWGMGSSIAVDSNNNIHISYSVLNETARFVKVKYATNASGKWVTRTIAKKGVNNTSIALDTNNRVYILYVGVPGLQYATNASGSWVIKTVPNGFSSSSHSLAIDSKNKLHISSVDYNNNLLWYATNASGSWVSETVDNAGPIKTPSIAVDSDDKAYISYCSVTSIKYATNASGSWVIETIDSSKWANTPNPLVIDANNKAHIVYMKYPGDLMYDTNASGLWVDNIVDHSSISGKDTSIAIDSEGKTHISYQGGSGIEYATNASGSWIIETVDSAEDLWLNISIAIDSMDNVHISYYDGHSNSLKYATNASGSWVSEIIDSANVYSDNSIAIDSKGNVHISYEGVNQSGVKHATNASSSWVIETVDGGGADNSMAIDSKDNVHISYSDGNSYSNSLKYATNASGSWIVETVDNNEQKSSITIDSNDNVHITYSGDYNSQRGGYNLKYATNASGAWVIETVDFGGNVWQYNSIAIDSKGKAHISYSDSYSYGSVGIIKADLKYATNASGAWASETVDRGGDVGGCNSLAIDSNDEVHIGYYGNGDLKYAVNHPVKLLSPNGGEIIAGGSTYSITWSAPSEAVQFKLMYSMNNGKTWKKIQGVPYVTGSSYAWKVPSPSHSKTACLVQIAAFDSNGKKLETDISDAIFTVE